MKRYAFNIELANKIITKAVEIPLEANTIDYLEEKYGQRVYSYDEKATGSTTDVDKMGADERKSFEKERNKALEIAKDFFYPQNVIIKIELARSCVQLDNVMAEARHMI